MREAPLRHRHAPRLSEARAPRHAHPPAIVRRIASEISAGLPTPRQQRRLTKVTPAPFRLTPAAHERYLTLALSRRVPNPAEEKTILGEAGYSHLERLRQQRYVHELRTRPEGFGNRLVEGATKGALGAVHFALPIDLPWQARKAVHDYMRHPTVKRALDVTALTAPVAAGFGDIREPGAPKPEDFVTPSKKSLAAKPEDTRIVQRPRTRQEAEQRLRALDRQIDTLHRRVGKAMGSPLAEPDIAAETQRLRNVKGGRFGQRARGAARDRMFGAPVRRQTVSEELRQQAMNRLDEIARKHPDHPAVVEYNAALAERDFLQNALHGHMPGEEPAGAFGHVAEVARTPQAEIRNALGGMRRARVDQEALRREERSVRVARGQAALERAGGGIEGFQAAMREQRGAYPTGAFTRLREGTLREPDIQSLVRHIQEHPDLPFWQQQRATKALLDAWHDGRVLQKNEIGLLEKAFGPDARDLEKVSTLGRIARKAYAYGVGTVNVPRSLMSTLDVSFGGRQGIVALAGHPRLFGPRWVKQFRYLLSEGKYQDALAQLEHHPEFEHMQRARLAITTQGRAEELAQREEMFPSQVAEKIPLIGHVVRASGRAYSGLANDLRVAIYDDVGARALRNGENVESPKFQRTLARYANVATGRGGLSKAEPAGPLLNAAFFAPRLASSRVAMLNPFWYASLYRGSPTVARVALRSAIQLAAGGGLVLYGTTKLLGSTVGTDPLNADFAKAKFGHTRADVFAGFQQYVRLAAQLYKGKIVSSTSGKTITLGPGIGHMNREDIAKRFATGKFNPTASFVDDFFRGTDFQGQPFTWKRETLSRITPLVAQDTWDLYHDQHSVPLASLSYVISALGIGMQTYGPRQKKTKRSPSGGLLGSGGPNTGGGGLLERSGAGTGSGGLLGR